MSVRPTPEQVKEIRDLWKSGKYGYHEIQAKYPFDIRRIIYNTAYYDVDYFPPIRYARRGNKGEKHYRAILSKTDVRNIRFSRAMGARIVDLAKRYGVARTTISQIISGKRWKN